ncbi:hypothetical protein M9458_036924 [Cirrhinus mrigala]|uniref:Uncharacterized protein n=1 Tax=Cirrhinus mrigala TaxID=683832 RepID=A0ABD0P4M0_CIRMR
MNDPAVLILVLMLEQGERSLEDHTTDFVFLANMTHYPDSCLCSFYQAGLNTTTRAQLSKEGPQESLAAYVEWVVVSCNSPLAMDFTDDDTSPTLDPEPSPASPQIVEHEPEPTADGEPEPSATEPSPNSDSAEDRPGAGAQSASLYAIEEVTVEHEDAEEGPIHCTSAEGELKQDLGLGSSEKDLINFDEDIYADRSTLIPPSSELFIDPEPSVCPDLSACLDFPPSFALSTHPSLSHATSVSLQPHCSPSALVAGGSLVSASSLRVLDSTSAFRPSGSALAPVVSSASTMAPPSVGRHHGCGLGLAWLLLLWVPSVSTLAPPSLRLSDPPWAVLSPPWLLPSSDPPWTLLSPPWLLPPSSPPWTFPSSARSSSCIDFLLPSHVHSFVHLLSPTTIRPFF